MLNIICSKIQRGLSHLFVLRSSKVEIFSKYKLVFLRSFVFSNCQMAMLIIVASVVHFVGDFKFFNHFKIIFFSAELVSAEKLSALFRLRQFYSVATLKFKCFAWHVFLDWNFIETYENFSKPGLFSTFFCTSNIFLCLFCIAIDAKLHFVSEYHVFLS